MTTQDIQGLKNFLKNKFNQQDVKFDSRFTGLTNVVEQQNVKFDRLSQVIESHRSTIDALASNVEAQSINIKQLADIVEQQGVELRVEITQAYEKLDAKIDSLSSFVFEALDIYHNNHEVRIVKLESRKA